MSPGVVQVLVGSVVGIVTVLVAVYKVRAERVKIVSEAEMNQAEIERIIRDGARDWIKDLEARIKANEEELVKVKEELAWEKRRRYQLERWAKILFAEVVENGGQPTQLSEVAK